MAESPRETTLATSLRAGHDAGATAALRLGVAALRRVGHRILRLEETGFWPEAIAAEYQQVFAARAPSAIRRAAAGAYSDEKAALWQQVRQLVLPTQIEKADSPAPMYAADTETVSGLAKTYGDGASNRFESAGTKAFVIAKLIEWYRSLSDPIGLTSVSGFRQQMSTLMSMDATPGSAWPGGAGLAMDGMAAATVTASRAAAAAMTSTQLGLPLRWETAEDEKVCSRCGAMHGRVFSAALVEQHLQQISGLPLPDLKKAHPWMSETEFETLRAEADMATDPAAVFADAGVLTPPLHGMCRCRLVPTGSPSLPDSQEASRSWRVSVAESRVGPDVMALPPDLRSPVVTAWASVAGLDAVPAAEIREGSVWPIVGAAIALSLESIKASADPDDRNDASYAIGLHVWDQKLDDSMRAEFASAPYEISSAASESAREAFAQIWEAGTEDLGGLPRDVARFVKSLQQGRWMTPSWKTRAAPAGGKTGWRWDRALRREP